MAEEEKNENDSSEEAVEEEPEQEPEATDEGVDEVPVAAEETTAETTSPEAEDDEPADETEEEAGDGQEMEDLEASMREGGADEEAPEETGEEEEERPKPVIKHEGEFYGTGRRKESVARVWIEAGDGDMKVNGKDPEHYFQNRPSWLHQVNKPLEKLGFEDEMDVWATLEGGGLTGQAGALQLGIARALVEMDENARPWLKEDDMLTRDDRQVERKKINQPGARAKQQVSKR